MNYKIIILESIIWSVLWMVMISIAIRKYPFTLEHDYPEDVRKVANIKQPSKSEKIKGMVFSVVSILLLFGLLIVFAILHGKSDALNFQNSFFHIWIVSMSWNVIDLIIVDWILICKFSCKLFMLPGTETYAGNKHYLFHFKGFLKGLIAMSIFALTATSFAYVILSLI